MLCGQNAHIFVRTPSMLAQFSLRGVELWVVAGWTMLHFLWLGTLVALAAMVCRLLVRRASAEARYATALTSLAVLVALPAGIAAWLLVQAPTMPRAVVEAPPANEIIELHPTIADPAGESARGLAGRLIPNDGHLQNAQSSTVVPRDTRQTAASFVATTRGLASLFSSVPLTWVSYLPWIWLIGTPLTFVLLATGIIG